MREPVWLTRDDLRFPDPELALKEPNGLLAIGGDLSQQRLLAAYRMGIFPWYEADQPILWWSPDPRMVLYPDELHISRSLGKAIKKKPYTLSINQNFPAVIKACAEQRGKNRDGTWISPAMQTAYHNLYLAGWAHSIEVWQQEQLVGGLYGIALGGVFFGESMFSIKANASKIAFVYLVERLHDKGYTLIDCQVSSEHLASLGAREIKREKFQQELSASLTLNPDSAFSL